MSRSRAERQLILLSAGTATRRRQLREHASSLIDEIDWQRLTETLRVRRLLPTLGPRILELAQGGASESFTAAVEQAIVLGRRQSVCQQLVGGHVMDTLAAAGIRSSPLKGPWLGEAVYGDPGRRLSADIDLLVAPAQLSSAVEVVRELGYGAPTDPANDDGMPLLHFALVHERGELPPVELHWRIHWYEQRFAHERLLAPEGSTGDWRPAPADELAALLLFYARDGFADLRLAGDLSAWWDAFGHELSVGAIDRLLRTYPALSRAMLGSLEAAERIVGLPADEIVESAPVHGLRNRMAVRLANPNPSAGGSQLHAETGLIDGLLSPPGDFGAFVRRQVLLPREVFDERARRAVRWRARSPLDFSLGMTARCGLAAMRTVRSPERLHLERSKVAQKNKRGVQLSQLIAVQDRRNLEYRSTTSSTS
jgi:Uncharacterised nucleotidyltransferase